MITWEFTPIALPLFVGSILMLIIAIVCWMRRNVVGALVLMGICICGSAYAVGYGLELGATSTETALTMLKFEYLSVITIPLAVLIAIYYLPNAPKTLPVTSLLLFIIPAITVVLAFTNEHHELIWSITDLDRTNGYTLTLFDPGAWYPVSIGYNTLIMIISVLILLYAAVKTRGLYRRQSLILGMAVLIPLVATVLYLADVFPPGLDPIPYSMILSAMLFAYAIFRNRLIDVMPIARDAILQGMHEPVIVIDGDDRLIYLNEAAKDYTSLPADQAIGKPIKLVFAGWKQLLEKLRTQHTDHEELTITAHGGARYFNLNQASIIKAGSDKGGRLMVLTDITERVKAEQQLEAAYHLSETLNTELEAFAHTVAHDLKNPLATILGYTTLITDETWKTEPEKFHLYLGKISQSAEKAAEIIDALLMLSGVRAAQTVELGILDMDQIVTDVCARLNHQIEEAKAEIITPSSWLAAEGYAPWVEEIWANYLSNAIKYGGSPPVIELGSTAENGGKVRFYVKDNGAGLTQDEQQQIFIPFSRLSQANIEGHGLGLSIVQRIAEKLGGEVGITSAVGEGSTFSFTLPSAETQ